MTTPFTLESIVPSKAKAWVGLIGALLTIAVPWVSQTAAELPEPWPGVIGLVLAVLTGLGVYKAPYKPEGTVLAPVSDVVPLDDYPADDESFNKPAPPSNVYRDDDGDTFDNNFWK